MTKSTKKNATLPTDLVTPEKHLGELTPISCEFSDINEVCVYCKTKTGDAVTFTLTTDSMMCLINLMVALVQNFSASFEGSPRYRGGRGLIASGSKGPAGGGPFLHLSFGLAGIRLISEI